MPRLTNIMNKQLLAAAAALVLAAPVAAQAQEVPSYAMVQSDQQIQGRITAFDGSYNLQVRDDNGYVDNVELHDGTIINPTGLTLAPGMVVSILGDNAGNAFDANEIDTPYNVENDVAYYSGHPWNYYGPSVSLSFFFGNTGWWHGPVVRGGYEHSTAFIGESHVNRITVNNYNEPTRVARTTPERNSAPVERAAAPSERSAPPHVANAAPRGNQHSAAAPARGSAPHDRR
jgi:opacity protein-like surface antigen